MRLMHPQVLRAALAALGLLTLALLYFKRKENSQYKGGIRVGNAWLVRNLPEFRKLTILRTFLVILSSVSLIAGAGAAIVLASRPYKVEKTSLGVKKRDIFLCLDVSYSLYDLNYDVADYLEEIVRGLEGDRIGITMFNTSSVVYVPMTDDYDFILMMLEEMKTYFRLQKKYVDEYSQYMTYYSIPEDQRAEYDELYNQLSYFEAGTLVNNSFKGSSLIGEGLASCLFAFPQMDGADRTRAVILVTDNEELARRDPVVELDEAAGLCKAHDVRVYGVAPAREYDNAYEQKNYDTIMKEMEDSVKITGGRFYMASENFPVSSIVSEIHDLEAKTVGEITMVRQIDQPVLPAAVLAVCLLIFLGTGMVLRRW